MSVDPKTYWCKYTGAGAPRYFMVIPITQSNGMLKCLSVESLGAEDMSAIKRAIKDKTVSSQEELVEFAKTECKNFNSAYKTIKMSNINIISVHKIKGKAT